MTNINRHILTLFTEAVEYAGPAEQAAYLDRACGDQPEVRARVEALLRAHREAGHFLEGEAPTPPSGATVAEPLPGERPGTVIGPYRLLQPLGEGGMGTVYLAEQTHPVQRQVALKLIRPGLDSRQVIARFEQERQALALMDHPNIAKVHDAGTTPDGRPFFVMELVQGVPITRYCDEHRLTPRQRLELFIPVCQAVQHAHQKGIIHRDLKPSNVLIALYDGRPVPKVIDFGVAKATEQRLTERTLLTEVGAVVGTLEYMSPEQAGLNPLDTDTRSDVYALGVLLYKLLTGSTPLDRQRLRGVPLLEVLRRIREEEPQRPSARLDSAEERAAIAAHRGLEPSKLSGQLRQEVDWIVLKCLEKDRDRRYESSSALAADLERYLADEAVLACPPSAWYRFRKFARRNKASLLTVTTVLVGLAVSTLLIARAYHEESLQRVLAEKKEREARAKESEANAERLRAEESRKDALAQEKEARDVVDRFLWRVSCDKLLYQPGLQPMRRELLEHALRYYRRYLHKHEYDPAFLAEAATVYCGVGEINRLMGQKAASGQAYEKARAIGEKLVQERPTHAHRKVLALAYLLSGNLFRETGPLEEALRHYRSAVPLYEALVEADPKNLTLQRDRASLYGNMSLVFQRMASPAEALRHQQEAVKLWAHLVQSNGHFQFRADLATAHVQMAGSLINLGRHEQARACTERAVQILAPLVTDSGIAPDLRNALARAYENLGLTCTKARDLDKALAWFEKARAHLDRLVRDNPAVTDYQSSLGRIYFDIGMTHYLANRDQDSLSMLEEARRLQEPLARAHPTVTEYVRDLGLTYHHLGGIQTEPDKQRRYHDLARELQERLLEGDPGLPTLQAELALTYRAIAYSRYPRAGQFSEGRKYYAKAIDLLEQAVRKQPAEFLNRMRLAAVCSEFGALQPEPDEKLRYYDRARAVLEQLRAEFPEEFAVKAALARSYQLIAYWRYKCVGRYPQALEYFERARGLFEEAAKDPTLRAEVGHLKGVYWEIAKGNHLVGMGHVRGGRLNEGIDAFTRGRAVNRTLVERFPDGAEYWRELIVVNVALGVCLQKAGKPKEAEAAYREAVEVLRRAVLGKHIPAADLARDQLFAPLRSREDFQKLVAEVNGKQ